MSRIPFVLLVQGLLYAWLFLINLFRRGQPSPPGQSENYTGIEGLPEAITRRVFSPEAILVMKWSLLAIVAVLVLIFLSKAIFRYQSYKSRDDIEEVNESLWNWGGFKSDLRLFSAMLWHRLQPKEKRPGAKDRAQHRYSEDSESVLSIREAYRHLLWEASYSGVARLSHETPYEYAERLSQSLPDGRQQLRELTDLYVGVRYDPATGDKQLDYANSLWQVIRESLRRLAGDQPV